MLDSNFYTSMSSVLTQWSDFKVSKNLYKAYFDMKKAESSSSSETKKQTKTEKDKNTYKDRLSKLSSGVSSAVSGLESAFAENKETGEIDYDKAYTAAEKFVSSYNELVSGIRESGDQTIVGKSEFISKMTNAYSKRLQDVGISIGSDGKLAIDKDTFKGASEAQLKKIFGKSDSFASFMSGQASQLSRYAAAKQTAKNTETYTQTGKTATENAFSSGAILNMLS